MYFFFFSSRRRHTIYWRDWSSDVCSSDLPSCDGGSVEADVTAGGGNITLTAARARIPETPRLTLSFDIEGRSHVLQQIETRRSEERRVGKESRSRWSPYH